MQKTEIHWSPNDRNQLAEIGAEIIIHTFDRPLSGESGKCVLGGTNKRTTSLNYPLHEKNYIKVCYIVFSNGKCSKTNHFSVVHGGHHKNIHMYLLLVNQMEELFSKSLLKKIWIEIDLLEEVFLVWKIDRIHWVKEE